MTISSQTRKAGPYSGTGSTGPFTFSFKVFENTDLLVVKVNNSTNIETTLTLTTDYTVSLNADQNANPGGTVTLVAALAVGYNMVISSQVPYLQETDLTNQGGFYPEVVTDALDRLTIEAQQLKEEVDRSAKLPITSAADADALVADIVRLADSADNIDTVASNIGDVNTVADDISDVTSVAGIAGAVSTVSGISSSITSVASNSTNINAVASNSTNINAVAGNSGNINNVAGNQANINTVAGISSSVTTVAGNSANVSTVAGISSSVSTVAGISANVVTVAGVASSIPTVASNVTDITNFSDVYYGPSSGDPSSRRDGSALQVGDLYFNTASSKMRARTSTGWVDTGTAVPVTITTATFNGNASTTAFTLPVAPSYNAGIDVFISGVAQKLTTDFTVSGTTLTFTSAPPSGTANIYVKILSAYAGGVPNDGSVTTAKLVDGAVTAPKLASGAAVSNIGYTPVNLAVANSFTAAQRGTVVALTDATSISSDFATGNNFSVTLGGNRTLANPTNLVAGQSGVIKVAQDGTGSRTLAYGSYWKFAGGTAPTLTTAASAVDLIAYYVDSNTRIDARWIGDVK